MTAKEAREQSQKADPNSNQLPLDSYFKWLNKRIETKVNKGSYVVSPVFDGMTTAPNKETCVKIAVKLQEDGYTVEFDDKGVINKISW